MDDSSTPSDEKMVYNYTLAFQYFLGQTIISMFGSNAAAAIFIFIAFVILTFILNIPTDAKIAILLFTGANLVAPATYGGLGLFPADSNIFLLIGSVGAVILVLAALRLMNR